MLITLAGPSTRPVYLQLADAIRRKIAHGEIAVGKTLPTARNVAAALDMNMHTVLRAYDVLRDEGLVDVKRGRGATVTAAGSKLAAFEDDIEALVHRAHRSGISTDTLAAMVHHADRTHSDTTEGTMHE